MIRSLVILLLTCSFCLPAQTTSVNAGDSLRRQLAADSVYIYRFRKIRPYFNYHERNSLGNPHPVNFYGPQLGAVLYERHIVGSGIYFSTKRTRQYYSIKDEGKTATEGLDFRYGTFFYQYILISRRFFELHIPLEAGYGYYHADYRDSLGERYRNINTDLTMAGAGLLGIIKPFKWIGIANSIGYRKGNQEVINGFYYAIGIWIGFKNLSNDISYIMRKKRYRDQVRELGIP